MKCFNLCPLLVAIIVTAGAGGYACAQDKPKPRDSVKPSRAAAPLRDLFQELDANGDRSISPDEVAERGRDAFQTLLKYGDKDKDGQLTAEEYRALLQSSARAVPAAANPEQRKKRFAKLDANSDGKLDEKEIPGGAARLRLLDQDGDKLVSSEEFLAVQPNRPEKVSKPKPKAKKAKAQAKKPEEEPKSTETQAKKPEKESKESATSAAARRPLVKRLKAMDQDGDNRVSREEFRGLPRVFSRLDTNHDGFVDRLDRRGKGSGTSSPGESKPGEKPKAS